MNITESERSLDMAAAPARFEREAGDVLQQLRGSVAAVLAAVPDLDGTYSATDVQRALRINSKMSWQIHKVATTASALDVASHVPKRAAMKRFRDAAARRGVPDERLQQLMHTFGRFDQLVDRHAGDRATFDSMVGALSSDAAASQLHQQHRRDAFRAQSHIWGVQARATISLMMFRPGRQPDSVDGITVGGHVNLRRFRHDARWILFGRTVASDTRIVGSAEAQPLDRQDFERYGVPLLSKFCTMPRGTFRMIETDAHVRYIEASAEDIGNNSAATYLSGEAWRNVAYTDAGDEGRLLLARARVRLPVEVLYHDVLVHRDLPIDRPPQLRLFGDLRRGDEALSHEASERLPCYEAVAHLGRGFDGIFAQEFARYPELAHDALAAVGWRPEEFDAYRCRIAYPVLPSTAVIVFRKRGGDG